MTTALSGAVLVQRLEDRYGQIVVASGTTISGGTLLALSDANTGAANTGNLQNFAGVLIDDKDGLDTTQTRMAVSRGGVWDIFSNDAAVAGDMAVLSGANMVGKAADDTILSGGQIVGMYLQNAASQEQVEVLVGR